ncbi:MAG: hypothetical protein R3E95_18640 [Thiolinea sp.]
MLIPQAGEAGSASGADRPQCHRPRRRGGVEPELQPVRSGCGTFEIDAQGNLRFVNGPDYNNPADADGNNVYEIVVTVTDSQGATDTQAVTVQVNNDDRDGDGLSNLLAQLY